MMTNNFMISIVAITVITISLRALPIVFLSEIRLPTTAQIWLGFIPGAIMAAMIAAQLKSDPALTHDGWSISLLATIAALAVGMIRKSLFWTVATGTIAFLVFQAIIP